MKKFIELSLCLLLFVLFSYSAMAGNQKYVEGEVFVEIYAPAFDDYEDMAAYSQAILQQAEVIASKYGLELKNTHPEIARASGKSLIILRSENKSTKELMKEISSDPDVINVSPNHIYEYIEPFDEGSGGCNAGMGSTTFIMLVSFVLLKIKRLI